MSTNGKAKLDSILAEIQAKGFEPDLTPETYDYLLGVGLHSKNLALAIVATCLR